MRGIFGYLSQCHRRMAVFWDRHPALFFGACLFFGAHESLVSFSVWDLLFLPLVPFVFTRNRCLLAGALFILAASTTSFRVVSPVTTGTYLGQAVGYVLDRRQTHFHEKAGWTVQFYISRFENPQSGVNFSGISVPVHCQSPCLFEGGFEYSFPARLVVDCDLRSSLHLVQKQTITRNRSVVSLVEWRVQARRSLEQLFVTLFPDHEIRQVASALTFALQKDDLLQEAMHRCGVEHVLAVSGFHFGIIAALLFSIGKTLERLFPQGLCRWLHSVHMGVAVAMGLLTAYLAIIGPLPSVVRAYTACFIALMAPCLNRRANAIQVLGCGLIVAVLFDPLSTCSLGFELSFLATLAIVLFSKPLERVLLVLFPQRSLHDVAQFPVADQFLRLVLKMLIPVFSLTASVMLLLVPYELTYLQDFSLMGTLYNMLIPALFSLAMPCILCAVATCAFPIISIPCAFLAGIPLQLGLYFVQHAPILRYSLVDGALLPATMGRLLIIAIVIVGMVLNSDDNEDRSWQGCL